MMELRLLNAKGLSLFEAFLDDARNQSNVAVPEILTADDATTIVEPSIQIDPGKSFTTRRDLAEYLTPIIQQTGIEEIESATGLWSWIALLYFDRLCPITSGHRVVRDSFRYILNRGTPAYNFRRAVRHLVFSPVFVMGLHQQFPPMCLLCQPVHIHPDMAEQLASYQELIAIPSVVQAADSLYYDASRQVVRRGATDRNVAGTVRRLIAVCTQLDRTYDLYSLSAAELISLLPSEFDRFR